MEAINPLKHYYNLFCLSILSENINKVRIAVLLFLKIKLHNGAEQAENDTMHILIVTCANKIGQSWSFGKLGTHFLQACLGLGLPTNDNPIDKVQDIGEK